MFWSMGYLHDLGLEAKLKALVDVPSRDPRPVADVLARVKPDTVMGALP